jgi:hypothetical protein
MKDLKRKCGVIRSWQKDRGFGIIVVPNTSPLEKYFLHISNIFDGTDSPTVGQLAYFKVSDKPVTPGKFPLALAVRIDVVNSSGSVEKVGSAL